jgi:hypothetical protein
MASVINRLDKVLYYATNVVREIAPQSLFRARLQSHLSGASKLDRSELRRRINYYNQMDAGSVSEIAGTTIGEMPLRNTFYYYDLRETARYFPRALRMEYRFGDVTFVPGTPSLVKSRPIGGDVSNSVLMKLDKLRHYGFHRDPLQFSEKKPQAVWRGNVKLNPKRLALVRRWHGHACADIGHAGGRSAAEHANFRGAFLSPVEQMAFKYVVSVEGNDVATNLKWIMASNSLCFMPLPVYETWFMEGRLEPGTHYVALRPDFEDLADKIAHYERNPDEAAAIIRNAQAHVRQFLDGRRERLISLLVLYKYFVATGQLEPDDRLADLFGAGPGSGSAHGRNSGQPGRQPGISHKSETAKRSRSTEAPTS